MPQIEEVPPKYLQIAGHIRDQIERGELAPGAEVPSEREIATTWNVARPTATKAVSVLRQQGLVESRQGTGTFVRDRRSAARARERYDRATDPAHESVEIVKAEIVTAPNHVAAALGLEPGSEAIERQRVITDSSAGPIELSTSWFDAAIADSAGQLLRKERLAGGVASYIVATTGRKPVYARDQVSARLANAVERRLLDLPRPAAVLVHWLTAFDPKDRPLQFDETVFPGDYWTFHQEYSLAT